jgi:hypothetical protein
MFETVKGRRSDFGNVLGVHPAPVTETRDPEPQSPGMTHVIHGLGCACPEAGVRPEAGRQPARTGAFEASR